MPKFTLKSENEYRCEDLKLTARWSSLGGKRPYGVWITTHDSDDDVFVMTHTLDQIKVFLDTVGSEGST